jgi:hypothetical protein
LSASHVAWLAGSGRSGTTWLSGLLAAAPRTVQVFEPLNPTRGPLPARLDPPLRTRGRPYLRPGRVAPTWEAFVDEVGTGATANRWTRFGHNRRTRWPSLWWQSLRARHRLVKEIRANLLIGWIAAAGRARAALVLRHPCATVLSQEEGGWDADLDAFLNDQDLMDDWLRPHADWLGRLESRRERLAARWAIENLVPMRQAERGVPLAVIHYEDIVADPRRATERLGTHLGLAPGAAALERAARRRVGARPGSSGSDPLSRWREKLGKDDVTRILDVCRRLGMSCYDEGSVPVERSPAVAS